MSEARKLLINIPSVIGTCLIIAIMLGLINFSRTGKLKIKKYRPLAAVLAIDECIGRAAEMNRPVMQQNRGKLDADTLAGIAFLGKSARLCARHDVDLIVTTSEADTFTSVCEVVRDAYRAEGKPEKYSEERMFFGGGERQAFINMTMNMILRERPASIITVGGCSEEIIQFSDIGASIGALQIGGSSKLWNIGFLATMFDYCLIGEEIFAANAQLEPTSEKQASLVSIDWIKFILITYLVIGTLLITSGVSVLHDILL